MQLTEQHAPLYANLLFTWPMSPSYPSQGTSPLHAIVVVLVHIEKTYLIPDRGWSPCVLLQGTLGRGKPLKLSQVLVRILTIPLQLWCGHPKSHLYLSEISSVLVHSLSQIYYCTVSPRSQSTVKYLATQMCTYTHVHTRTCSYSHMFILAHV